jgi:hypothetical protein
MAAMRVASLYLLDLGGAGRGSPARKTARRAPARLTRLLEQGPFLQGAHEEGRELVDVDRFGQVLARPGLEGLDGSGDIAVPGEDEDGEVAVRRAEAPRNLDAVQIGHDEVGNDGVGRLLGAARQQGVGPLEQLGAEPARPQVRRHELGVHQVVVENVDCGIHQPDAHPRAAANIGNGAPPSQDPWPTCSGRWSLTTTATCST